MADLKLLEALCNAKGVSGNDDDVKKIIIDCIKDHCEKLYVDKVGNLIAFKKGENIPANKLMICAHTDEVGLMITGILKDGTLTFENVGGIAYGQVRGVGVVRSVIVIGCSDNVGPSLSVMLCKTEGGRLCGSSLKVVEVAVHFLVIGESFSHVVEDVAGESLRLLMSHIGSEPLCVKTDLVHTDKTDGREVVVEGSEVSLGVGVESLLKKLCDNRSLCLERTRGDVHKLVKSLVEVLLALGEIRDTGHIDGNDTDRSRGFTRAEEAARLLAKLTKVKTEAAAH